MIINGELNEQQRRKSQLNFCLFSLINGTSYMCLGEIIVILFAIKLGVSNIVIAALSSMLYIGFLMLPAGSYVTARVGVAKCQAKFWTARSIAALVVALAAPVAIIGNMHNLAVVMVLSAVFVFYGCRAAAVVMSNPLFGGFTLPHERGKFIGTVNAIFYIGAIVSLLIIYFILRISNSIWVLGGIIIVGAALGIASSSLLAKVDEPAYLQQNARRPIMPEITKILFNKTIQKQFWASGAISMAIYLTSPMSILALKRGYGIGDTDALLYSAILFGFGAVCSLSAGKISAKIGSRRLALSSYMVALSVPLLWIFAPKGWNSYYLFVLFALCGVGVVTLSNSINQYFLATVSPKNRIIAGMTLFLISGAGAGILSLAFSSGVFAILGGFFAVNDLVYYKIFFACVFIFLLPGLWLISRLKHV